MPELLNDISRNTIPLLWDKLYDAGVPELALHSEEELRLFGSYTTVDKKLDKDLLTIDTKVVIPVVRMIEHHSNGYRVKISYENTLEIYDNISLHLYKWRRLIETSINRIDAPIDDLLNFDEFADELFNYIKYEINNNSDSSLLTDSFREQGLSSLMREGGLLPPASKNNVPLPSLVRKSYSNFFKSYHQKISE